MYTYFYLSNFLWLLGAMIILKIIFFALRPLFNLFPKL